jgi:hypothetical protein
VNASRKLLYHGLLELVSENPVMIILNDTTLGTTGRHAFGEPLRPVNVLSNLYGHISRSEEALTRRKELYESPSFRKK